MIMARMRFRTVRLFRSNPNLEYRMTENPVTMPIQPTLLIAPVNGRETDGTVYLSKYPMARMFSDHVTTRMDQKYSPRRRLNLKINLIVNGIEDQIA
jgi:hypothetical protein